MNEEQFFKLQNSKVYRFFERLSQLIIVNLCAIAISACGLFVFGLFPVIFAVTAFFNDMLEQRCKRTFSTLFAYFKKYFWTGNLLMLVTVPTIFLAIYMIFGQELNMIVYLVIMTLLIFVLILNLYMPSIVVLYPEFSLKKKIVFSFVAACDRWKTTILLMILYVVWIYAVALIPQFCMFIFLSTIPWFSIWLIKKALKPETILDPTAPIPEDYFFSQEEEDNK